MRRLSTCVRYIRRELGRPFQWTRGLVLGVAVLLGVTIALVGAFAVFVINDRADGIERDQLTALEVRDISGRLLAQERPTEAQENARTLRALSRCVRRPTCQLPVANALQRIIRIYPRVIGQRRELVRTVERVQTIIRNGRNGANGQDGANGENGIDGVNGVDAQPAADDGAPLDSKILDLVDNQVAGIEGLLREVIAALCSPVSSRLLGVLGVCPNG
jgi:hypothetical protein